MKVLLWETSAVPWGVGVAEIDDGKSTLLTHFEDDGARTLARNVISSVDQVLTEAHCELADIGACAVSLGPGSWTGLRIGLTAAKTMAQSLNLPIMGIATFDIFAQALYNHPRHSERSEERTKSKNPPEFRRSTSGDPSVAALPQDDDGILQTPHLLLIQSPCRPGELYAKLWHCHGEERNLLESEWIGSYSQINNRLEFWMNDRNVSTVVTNTPQQKIEESFRQSVVTPLEYCESTFEERLQALAILSAMKMSKCQPDEVLQIQPIYLAPSAAEREYNAKHNRN